MSVQLLLECCCDCTWRQAYECYTDDATGYYKLASAVDTAKTYGIDDGADRLCVYFANCYPSNPGSEAANLTEYDDCEACGEGEPDWPNPNDEPTPCDCGDADQPLPDAYTVTGTLKSYDIDLVTVLATCNFEFVVSGTGAGCTWLNEDTPLADDCDGVDSFDASLTLGGDPEDNCAWVLGLGGYAGYRLTGGNPEGAYADQDTPGVLHPYGYVNMVVS